jgi:hypothetical protein
MSSHYLNNKNYCNDRFKNWCAYYFLYPITRYTFTFAVIRRNGTLVQYMRIPFSWKIKKATLCIGQRKYFLVILQKG